MTNHRSHKQSAALALVVLLVSGVSPLSARTAQPTATDCKGFMQNIRNSEGSGNYGTNTGNGYYGAYQMGKDALIDAGYMNKDGSWTGKNGVNSLEDYLGNSAAQDDAFLSYGNKNLGYLGNWQQYIGQTIGGVTVTKAGLIAGSHLVGAGGMLYWLQSGGDCTNKHSSSDAVDGNGTCAGTYVGENQTNDSCKGGDQTAGGGSCLSAQPVTSPIIFSEFAAWGRKTASGVPNGWHRGVDIYPSGNQGGSSKGQPIYAANSGKIFYRSMGPQVKGSDFWTRYLHSPAKGKERDVKAGEEIGPIGDVQSAGLPHLHFEVLVPGSRISQTKCVPGESTDNCAFPDGGPKRGANSYATSESLATAKGKSTWYYVNPERYLKERVPMRDPAKTRAGRSESLPNSCSPGTDANDSTPTSAGETDTATAQTQGDAAYNTGWAAVANAGNDVRSLYIDTGRQIGLEVRAAAEPAQNLGPRMDSALAHALLLYSQAY